MGRDEEQQYRNISPDVQSYLGQSAETTVRCEVAIDIDELQRQRDAFISQLLSSFDEDVDSSEQQGHAISSANADAFAMEVAGKTRRSAASTPAEPHGVDEQLNPSSIPRVTNSNLLSWANNPIVRAKLKLAAAKREIYALPPGLRPPDPSDQIFKDRKAELREARRAATAPARLEKRRTKDRERKRLERADQLPEKRTSALKLATAHHGGDHFLVQLAGREEEIALFRSSLSFARDLYKREPSLSQIAKTFLHITGIPMNKGGAHRTLAIVKKLELRGAPWHQWRSW